MRHIARTLSLAALACAAAAGAADKPAATLRNFVSCPIVRDTATVPCWLAEYDGELYYLGIQTDVSADFHPPYLGHKVLVEGTVKNAPRICGGIVLEPVKVAPLAELDGTCNQIWPAEAQYTVPFAPRPPGPSGGRLAFDAAPGTPRTAPPPLEGVQEFVIYYDFDQLVGGRHAGVLGRILGYATAQHARSVTITGERGAALLSDGTVLEEREELAQKRAREVQQLLQGAGVPAATLHIAADAKLTAPDGDGDWQARRTVVRVEP
jgi:hypothetical protein